MFPNSFSLRVLVGSNKTPRGCPPSACGFCRAKWRSLVSDDSFTLLTHFGPPVPARCPLGAPCLLGGPGCSWVAPFCSRLAKSEICPCNLQCFRACYAFGTIHLLTFWGFLHLVWEWDQYSVLQTLPSTQVLLDVSILYPNACIHIFFILYPCYIHIVFISYQYCIHIVSILYPYCVHIASTLFPYCTHIVFILYPYCIHIVSILYPYCIHFVPIVCP